MEGLWNTLLFYPFLNILFLLYKIFGSNIGLAVIALTILVRILLGPALKKQVAMTKKMGMLKPRLEELKKKYGKNPEKLSQEQLKLYKEVGYNPLGCFATMLPQFIILFAIIQAIPALTSSNLTGLYPFVKDFVTGGSATFTVNTMFLGVDLSKSFNDIINACNCIP
jgi:YidC/Oxa1 family membrane protein insertase